MGQHTRPALKRYLRCTHYHKRRERPNTKANKSLQKSTTITRIKGEQWRRHREIEHIHSSMITAVCVTVHMNSELRCFLYLPSLQINCTALPKPKRRLYFAILHQFRRVPLVWFLLFWPHFTQNCTVCGHRVGSVMTRVCALGFFSRWGSTLSNRQFPLNFSFTREGRFMIKLVFLRSPK